MYTQIFEHSFRRESFDGLHIKLKLCLLLE